MGEAFTADGAAVTLKLDILAPSPIERVDVFNGKENVAGWQPACPPDSRRLKLLWEGAEYRGRGRETRWDGSATLTGNVCLAATPINFWNPERPLVQTDAGRVAWQSITTGGIAGCELLLQEAAVGDLAIETPLVRETLPIATITAEDTVFDVGGQGRRLRVFRLPEDNPVTALQQTWKLKVAAGRDNPLYIRIRLADGHLAWSSPIYVDAGARKQRLSSTARPCHAKDKITGAIYA